jgi:hypothetical protein
MWGGLCGLLRVLGPCYLLAGSTLIGPSERTHGPLRWELGMRGAVMSGIPRRRMVSSTTEFLRRVWLLLCLFLSLICFSHNFVSVHLSDYKWKPVLRSMKQTTTISPWQSKGRNGYPVVLPSRKMWAELGRATRVNGIRGLITCNTGALKSHNLQNRLTGHWTCDSCAPLVIKRFVEQFFNKNR